MDTRFPRNQNDHFGMRKIFVSLLFFGVGYANSFSQTGQITLFDARLEGSFHAV
jgi:hypothetical protein